MNVHAWNIGDGVGAGQCAHEPLDEAEVRDKPWLEPGSPAHKALVEVVLNPRFLKNVQHYVNFR